MLSFWLAFLGISFASTLTLTPVDSSTSTSQAFGNSSDQPEIPLSPVNHTNSSALLADPVIYWRCEEDVQLADYRSSCFDAMHQMAFVPGPATQQFIWAQRNMGTQRYDVPLPQGVISCMGLQSFASSFH